MAESIPFTAWEQASIVALFILFVISLLASLLAWFNRQSDKWQKFMFDIDDKWREFNKEQREENNCAMQDVNAGLKNLTKVTYGLVQEVKEMREDSRRFSNEVFRDHDLQAKEILDHVKTPAIKINKSKKE